MPKAFPFRAGEIVIHPGQGEVQIVQILPHFLILRPIQKNLTFRMDRNRASAVLSPSSHQPSFDNGAGVAASLKNKAGENGDDQEDVGVTSNVQAQYLTNATTAQAVKEHLLTDNSYCFCGKRLTMQNAVIDYIVPRSKGGEHVSQNVQILCKPCKGLKGADSQEKFLTEIRQRKDLTEKILTLVSKGVAQKDIAVQLELPIGKVNRLIAWAYNQGGEVAGEVLGVGYKPRHDAVALNHIDKVLENEEHEKLKVDIQASMPPPRSYQVEALRALSAEFAIHSSLLLALPTGSGKTFVAAKWTADHIIRRGGRVVWVAHRHELLEQAYATFRNLLHSEEVDSVTWWTGGKPKSANGRIILVSVAATLNFPQMTVDLLVIDEAHHEPASTYQRLKGKIQYKKHLGLTATPKRLDQKALGYEKIAYQRSFMSLVQEGWLARPLPVLPKTGLDFHFNKSEITNDFAEESLSLLDSDQRNQLIVEHWQSEAARYGKTLVFAVNRNHARRLVETFRLMVPEVESDYIVSSEGAVEDRQEKLERFRNGDIHVLVNCPSLPKALTALTYKRFF